MPPPLPLPEGAGSRWPRGPFCMPVRMSIRPMICLLALQTWITGISDDAVSDQSVPDEENDDRANGCADEARALVGPVPADGLADECREERSCDADDNGEDETGGIVGSRREHPGDDPGDEPDQDEPEYAHCALSLNFVRLSDASVEQSPQTSIRPGSMAGNCLSRAPIPRDTGISLVSPATQFTILARKCRPEERRTW